MPGDRSPSPASFALQSVALPDLSAMEPAVREQMRGAYSSLTSKIESMRTTPLELSDAYGALGKLLMAGEQLAAAEACYLNAQALAPHDRRWPYYLGHLYKIKGPLEKSIQSFERALELEPDAVPALLWLGEAYLAQGRPDAADAQFARALALEPQLVAARFGAGRAALARNDYARAVKYLEEALAADARETAAHYPLAMAYRGLGDVPRAEAHLRQKGDIQILPADPLMKELDELVQSSLAYDLRGGRALDAGDLPAAAAYFRRGVELAPASVRLRFQLAQTLFQMRDARGALIEYERALELDPAMADAAFGAAMTLAGLGQYQAARDRLDRAATAFPDQPRFRHALARLLAAAPDDRVRDGRRAMILVQELIKHDQSTELGETLAMTLAELRQYEQAAAVQRDVMIAAERAGRTGDTQRMANNLSLYTRQEPCRTPWPDGGVP